MADLEFVDFKDLLGYSFALGAHKGQWRRGASEPYFFHACRVGQKIYADYVLGKHGITEDDVSAALLHDVVEDCGVTEEDLRAHGFSERTIWLVMMLSKDPKNVKGYVPRLIAQKDPQLLLIKLADIADNSVIDPFRLWDGWDTAIVRYAKLRVKLIKEYCALTGKH